MTSILTNTGAMVALDTLQQTESSLASTQNEISTGLAIGSAKDNAAVWTVATTMSANVASLNQVSSDLGNADSILGTAVSGANQIESLVSMIRSQVVSFTDTSTNQSATAANVSQLADQIVATIESSSFNGVNLLDGTQSSGLTFIASTNNNYAAAGESTSATITTGATIDLNVNSGGSTVAAVTAFVALVSSLSTMVTSQTTLDSALAIIDTYSAAVESQASTLGSVQKNVESQQTFVNNLAQTFTTGAGNMVDANMEAESAKLTALQTQQQLGISSLSIANQAPQSILKLFQ